MKFQRASRRSRKQIRRRSRQTQSGESGTRRFFSLTFEGVGSRSRRSLEFLEPRLVLSGTYSGLGSFVGQEVTSLESSFAETALKNPIPILGNALGGIATASQNSLLQDYLTAADALDRANGVNFNDGSATASALQALFPAAQNGHGFTSTTVSFDTTTDLFTIDVTEVKPVSLSQFDIGLPALQFAGQANFQVDLTLTLDLTIGGTNGSFFLHADGSTSQIQVGVNVDSSQLPDVTSVTLGPLNGQATHAGTGSALALTYTTVVTANDYTTIPSSALTSTISGSANVDYQLTLSASGADSPKITSGFALNWSLSGKADGDESSFGGSAPTVTFSDVSLDMGSLLKSVGGSTIAQITQSALQPIFALANDFTQPIPGLSELSQQLQSELGDLTKFHSGITPLDNLVHAFATPNLLNVLTLAESYPGLSSDQLTALQTLVQVVQEINAISALNISNLAAGTVDFGNFTLQGADLRSVSSYSDSFFASLVPNPTGSTPGDVPSAQSQLQGDLNSADSNGQYFTLKSDFIDNPQLAAFELALGSQDVNLLEIVGNPQALKVSTGVTLFDQQFAIGIVPADFNIQATAGAGATPDFGVNSTVFAPGKNLGDGIYLRSGPLAEIDASLIVQLGIGTSPNFIVSALAGVQGKLNLTATFNINPLPGKQPGSEVPLNGLGTCPLEGSGTLTATAEVDLFADSSLNLSIQALEGTFESLFNFAVQTNPYVIAIHALINNPVIQGWLKQALGDSAANDLINKLNADINNPSQAIIDGLNYYGGVVSQGLKNAAANPRQAADQVIDAIPGGKQASDIISSGAAAVGLSFLTDGSSNSEQTVYGPVVLLKWPPNDSGMGNTPCLAVPGAGSASSASGNSLPNNVMPALATEDANGVLTLYVGPLASNRNIDPTDTNEQFLIRPANPATPNDGHVIVSYMGYSEAFPQGADPAVTKVVANAADGNKLLDATGLGLPVDFEAGNGNDTLIAGLGNAKLVVGDGTSVLTGGPGNDTLTAGNGNDTLTGGGGNNYLQAGNGNDVLYGHFAQGSPQDTSGAPADGGNDTIVVGNGADYLYAGPGDDLLDASHGIGNDTLIGGVGNDTLYGSAGNDVIDAGVGNQTIFVGRGNTFVNAGNGNDAIFGGDGNDTFFAGVGNDTILGGSGSDLFIYTGGNGNDTFDGGGGQNTLFVNLPDSGDQLKLTTSGTRVEAAGSSSPGGTVTPFSLDMSGISDLLVNATGGNDSVTVGDLTGTDTKFIEVGFGAGHTGADQITMMGSQQGDNVLATANGNLVNVTGLAAHVVFANTTPNDTMEIDGNNGTEVLTAAPGVQSLVAVTLKGGAGTNIITGDALLIGGSGINTYVLTGGSDVILGGGVYNTILLQGTPGNDTISADQTANNSLSYAINSATGTATMITVGGVPTVQRVEIDTGLGTDTASVTVADSLEATANESLTFYVHGDPSSTSDRLNVVDDGLGDTDIERIGQNAGTGSITIGQFAPVVFDNISKAQITPLNSLTSGTGTDGNGKLVVIPFDANEPNDTLANATYLGSGAAINVTGSIDPGASGGVPADEDWYRVVASATGTLDFQVNYQTVSTLANGRPGLPGNGQLDAEVRTSTGTLVPANFIVSPGSRGDRIRIPAVAGQTYYLHVFGHTPDAVNNYSVTVLNAPAPVPSTLELSRNNGAGDLPSNAPTSDTGRSQVDNVTNNNKPTIFIRLSDGTLLNDLPGNGTSGSPPAGVIPIPFSPSGTTPGFRVAIFDGNDTQNPVNPTLGFASQVAGFPGLYQFTFPTALADGVHHLTAEVQMVDPASTPQTGFGGASASLDVTIDTQPPPIAFGTGVAGSNTGLSAASDTGIIGQPALLSDRVTSESKPTFYGVAEANSIVRLYVQTPSGNVFIGQTTATPTDGTSADASGQWTITSNTDLNAAGLGLPLDGVRNLFLTAEDLAGNVSATQELTIFIDTQGPKVSNINISSAAAFPLFNTTVTPTPAASPTPLVSSLDVSFSDQPVRAGGFVYPAVNQTLATTTANYALVGENNGVIPITLVTIVDNTASGTPGMTTVTLHFPAKDTPLPDDRYTLTISNQITDNAGNALQGSFDGKSFPTGLVSGNGSQGQTFVGAFTVNSRAHLGNFSSGTVNLDINGNGSFDPQNPDANNRDSVVTMGYPTDRLFSGNFSTSYGATPVSGTANGFEKLAAYGQDSSGNFRWLYDLSGNSGGATTSIPQPSAIDGLPVAGNFAGSPIVPGSNPPVATYGDQVGLFDGKAWYLDVLNQGFISAADLAAPQTAAHPAGYLPSNMVGLPFVGNFDGYTDLGTYQSGVMEFDLASLDPNHILTGQWNVKLNVDALFPSNIAFNTVNARPVAGYFDGLAEQSSFGLWVPSRTDNTPGVTEWYILSPPSNAFLGAAPAPAANLFASGLVTAANAADLTALQHGNYFFNLVHPFQDPTLGGNDVFYQFGNQFSLPVVGVWDPPGDVGGLTSGGMPSASVTGSFVANLYTQILGRQESANDVAYWVNQLQSGETLAQVAQLFVTSDEYRANEINHLYEQYLGRAAEAAGIAYWTGVWNATGGPEQVQAGIISSPEYLATAQKLYSSLSADAAWVTALYQNILGRSATSDEVNFWVQYLQANSPQSVVLSFVTSDEYHLELVDSEFQTYLGRAADPASAQTLVEQLRSGMTQDQLLTLILSSAEYVNKSTG